MEKLSRELEELIMSSKMAFQEKNNRSRFAHWGGEELSRSSLRKNLQACGLGGLEKEIKSLQRNGHLEICLDDGWLHLELSNELLNEKSLDGFEWD